MRNEDVAEDMVKEFEQLTNNMQPSLTAEDFTRLANNYYQSQNIPVEYQRIVFDSNLMNYVSNGISNPPKKFKVAFCWICLNEPYWQYAENMIKGAKQFFLPGHDVDYFVWSDMPTDKIPGMTVFPTESMPWPMPTLMRYHLFLQQEEKLKEYDYVFYCDVDMQFVNIVGDEILGTGLTAALHPGYAIKKELYPPYEPNKESEAFIQRPGKVVNDNGKPRYMPMYFAGGLQGGKANKFIKAMKWMKKRIDKDLSKNYISLWNDEGHWNRYLEKTPDDLVVLTPSYIYPDSLIKEYYEPIVWGCSYQPKLVTLTKSFSVSKEGGEAVQKMINK